MIIAQVQARSGPRVIKLASIKARRQQESSASRLQKACIAEVPSRQKNQTGSAIIGPSRFRPRARPCKWLARRRVEISLI